MARLAFLACLSLSLLRGSALAPRAARVSGDRFIAAATGEPVVFSGPNVVVKGPPWLPAVAGAAACRDVVDDACAAAGSCSSCATFNAADVANLRARGWNALRLGVVWAGAQPRDEDALDPAFIARLHAILNLTDAAGLFVVLDNHGDMVGGAGCGNGVPAWFQRAAAPELIGAPLETAPPFSLVPGLQVTSLPGWTACGANATRWAHFAGDPNYNLLNECCQALNAGGNPGALGYTTVSQRTMDYLIAPGPGRAAFARFWRLVAEAVRDHPSAVAAELMNEPMTIWRRLAFDTWRAAGEAVAAAVPDMAVSVMDTGEGVLAPAWAVNVTRADFDISAETLAWIRGGHNVFYAWHWYGLPASADDAVADALAIGREWGVPTMATEFMDCAAWTAAARANVSHLYWHYSAYCTTGAAFGNRTPVVDTFGACILGWGAGNSAYSC